MSVTLICPDYVKTKLSMRAFTGEGKSFGQLDKQIMKGFEPSYVVRQALRGVYNGEYEVWICSIGRHIGLRILLAFPFIMRWYEGKKLEEQVETIKKAN